MQKTSGDLLNRPMGAISVRTGCPSFYDLELKTVDLLVEVICFLGMSGVSHFHLQSKVNKFFAKGSHLLAHCTELIANVTPLYFDIRGKDGDLI